MNEYNTRISKEDLKKLILSNRTEIDKTIREATDYLDTLHHASHILFHIVHAFSLYIDDEEIKNDLEHILAACRRESKPPFFLPPGPRGWHTKPFCAPAGGRNGADNQCSAPYFCSLRQTARGLRPDNSKCWHSA